MHATSVTVAVPVSDLAPARAWYDAVLNKPAELEPVPGVIEYELAGTWIQLASGRPGSPGWVLRYGVEDLEHERRRLEDLSIDLSDTETVSGVIAFFAFHDPDGNELSAYQVLG